MRLSAEISTGITQMILLSYKKSTTHELSIMKYFLLQCHFNLSFQLTVINAVAHFQDPQPMAEQQQVQYSCFMSYRGMWEALLVR